MQCPRRLSHLRVNVCVWACKCIDYSIYTHWQCDTAAVISNIVHLFLSFLLSSRSECNMLLTMFSIHRRHPLSLFSHYVQLSKIAAAKFKYPLARIIGPF